MQGQRSGSCLLYPNNLNRDGWIEILEAGTDSHSQDTQQQESWTTGSGKQEQLSETARMEMCQSQLLKTNQTEQSILLYRQCESSKPHCLIKTKQHAVKHHDHRWPCFDYNLVLADLVRVCVYLVGKLWKLQSHPGFECIRNIPSLFMFLAALARRKVFL